MSEQQVKTFPPRKQRDDNVNLSRLQVVVKGGSYGCHYHYHFVLTGNRVSIFRRTCYHLKRRFPLTPFFCFLPSVKSYGRALRAISKLSEVNINEEKSIEHHGTNKVTRYTTLTKSDIGFQDLLKILVERNHSFADSEDIKKCDEIRIMRTSMKVDIDLSKLPIWLAKIFVMTPPEIPNEVEYPPHETEWLTTLANGNELDRIIYSESRSPIKEFYDEVEDWLRLRLSYYVVGMIGIWLILTLCVIFFANYH